MHIDHRGVVSPQWAKTLWSTVTWCEWSRLMPTLRVVPIAVNVRLWSLMRSESMLWIPPSRAMARTLSSRIVIAWVWSSTIARTTALPRGGPEMVSRRDERDPMCMLVAYVPGFSVIVPPESRMDATAASNPAAELTLRAAGGATAPSTLRAACASGASASTTATIKVTLAGSAVRIRMRRGSRRPGRGLPRSSPAGLHSRHGIRLTREACDRVPDCADRVRPVAAARAGALAGPGHSGLQGQRGRPGRTGRSGAAPALDRRPGPRPLLAAARSARPPAAVVPGYPSDACPAPLFTLSILTSRF